MTKVLVVEDDASLRLALADNLRDEGYAVFVAASLREARVALPVEVLVLDVMLPDGDGISFCREVKQTQPGVRVLLLTSRTLEDDVVQGFDAGADDYVGKPYRLRELLARIGALARRGTGATINGYRVDVQARSVHGPSGEVTLTKKEFDLLAFLLSRGDAVAERDAILDAVWGEVVVDAHTVDNFVGALKKKLPGLNVKTVRGVGFKIVR